MVRSLYSAVSGLNTHMAEMDVIGNNIANVNTTAYKSQSFSFSDMLYQTTRNSSAATATAGSVNARQIGLGSRSGAIATNISAQGAAQTTNLPFDMMISGNSFFVVNNGTENLYTRDGTFTVDNKGDLVTRSNGYYVQGWSSSDGKTVSTTGTASKLSLINTANKTSAAQSTTAETFSGNIDGKDSLLSASTGKTVTAGVYASDGKSYTLKFKLTDAGDSDSSTYTMTLAGVTDASGTSVTLPSNADINLKYNSSDGKFVSANGAASGIVSINLPASVGGTLSLNFSSSTNYAGTTGSSTLKTAMGNADGSGAGRPEGTMNGITVSKNGMINATYSNGDNKLLGQIAVAEFANASGLEKAGENLYQATPNSGTAQMMDVTKDGGSIATGALEASNVDLADEFTRMITAQRGFQANSRVITTTDTMLSDLKQLKS